MSNASETAHFISWDKLQNLGDIPNTGWFGPDGHGQPAIRHNEQVATDNMQMLISPEGYHVIEVTGPYWHRPKNTGSYIVPLEGDRGMHAFAYTKDLGETSALYVQTKIHPFPVATSEQDYRSRQLTHVKICPQEKDFGLIASGKMAANPAWQSKLVLSSERNWEAGRIIIGQEAKLPSVNIAFNASGETDSMIVRGSDFLEGVLGLDAQEVLHATDIPPSRLVFSALVKHLGVHAGDRLDLAQTAQTIYQRMGQRNFDPLSALVTRPH